jgi:helicase
LLPAQVLAIEAGLLEGTSELIISSTSSGKTLIAELAGIPKLLQQVQSGGDPRQAPKLLYVVPLVALANQRGDEWTHRYRPLGLSVVTKVGVKQFDPEARAARSKANRGVPSADIIVGTYEGVDVLVRKGRSDLLGQPGTIVIDEIQMLGDPERGWFLDGFISRLRSLYPRAQFLYLSATISDPQELAGQLSASLVEYNGRPVPIERHFILCTTRDEKTRIASMLIKSEFGMTSKFGYKGQTIIFTNSRRNCHKIASTLQQMGIAAAAYHAGLTYGQRRRIEKAFIAQSVMCVVTTAALGAGLDLPASQVIFESLAMGRQWLSVAEFEQFSGRAGRLGKHERGKVVVLAEPGNQVVPKDKETEEQVAMRLFKGKILPLALDPDDMRVGTEILAYLATAGGSTTAEIDTFYAKMYHRSTQPGGVLRRLAMDGYTALKGNRVTITPLGQAVVEHFLTTEEAEQVREMLSTEPDKLLNFAFEMHPFDNLYVTNKMVSELAGSGKGAGGKGKDTGNHLYSALITDMLDASSAARHHHKLKGWVLGVLTRWATELFNCSCQDRPECDCARLNVERRIYTLVEAGLRDVPSIARSIRDDLELALFPGDLLSYLDTLIHSLRAIFAIGKAIEHDTEVAVVPQVIQVLTGVENWDIFEDPDTQVLPPVLNPPTLEDYSPPPPPTQDKSTKPHAKRRSQNKPSPAVPTVQSEEEHQQSSLPGGPTNAPAQKYPKRSPLRKREKANASTAGLTVEEFISHMDELAADTQGEENPPPRVETPPASEPPPPPPRATKPPAKLTPPKKVKRPKLPSQVPPAAHSFKKSPLGKLEKKKKREEKETSSED